MKVVIILISIVAGAVLLEQMVNVAEIMSVENKKFKFDLL